MTRKEEIGQEEKVLSIRKVGDAYAISTGVIQKWRRKKLTRFSPIRGLSSARIYGTALSYPLVRDIARMTQQLQPQSEHSSKGEAQVVSADLMAIEISAFCEKFSVLNPREGQSSFNKLMMRPLEWLEQESGINRRRIKGYVNREFHFVPFSHAEKLLIAMGAEYKLANGEIPVEKNPHWSWWQFKRFMRQQGVS